MSNMLTQSEQEIGIEVLPPHRGEPATILGNFAATQLLNDLVISMDLDGGQEFKGICLTPAGARLVRLKLRQWIDRGGLIGAKTSWVPRELTAVLHCFNKVSERATDTIYVDTSEDPETILRHELAHFAQRMLCKFDDDAEDVDAIAFLEHPIAQKAAAVLVRDYGYPDEPRVLSAEIGANLSQGPSGAEKMELTMDEGAELAELYFSALVAKHGAAAYRFRSAILLT